MDYFSNLWFWKTWNKQVGKLAEGVKFGRLELAKFVGLTDFQDIIEVQINPSTLFLCLFQARTGSNAWRFYVTGHLLTRFNVDYSGLLCFTCLFKARGITGGVLPRRLAEGTSC